MTPVSYKVWKHAHLGEDAKRTARDVARCNNMQIARVLRGMYDELKKLGGLPQV